MLKRLPAARRFVTLRASANNVMRKLEVQSLSALAGLWLFGSMKVLHAAAGRQIESCHGIWKCYESSNFPLNTNH